jgi:RimJ/RimL family protein N-acetyltransferase
MPVPEDWLEKRWLMQYRLEQLRNDPTVQPWLLRALVLRNERVMVGHAGFHSAPGDEYLQEFTPNGVEIGYTVYSRYRQCGYATEVCAALMDWAIQRQPGVRFVLSIRPDNVPSRRIAQRFGFQKVGSHVDERDGVEDIFLNPEMSDGSTFPFASVPVLQR